MRRSAGWTVVGVGVPLAVIAGLLVLSLVTDRPGVFVAFLAAVPMFAATTVGIVPTGIVAAAAVAAALTATAVTYERLETSTVPSLVGVILAAAVAVNASQNRSGIAPRRQQSAPAPIPAGALPTTQAASPAGTATDPVTGLPTRDAVLPGLTGRHLAATRVVAFLACDGLTSINAEHGTAVGDEVLFAVAGRTRYALPPQDIVARWGGDQVLLVLTADAASVASTLELLSGKVNAHPIRTASGLVPATMSIGAAVCPPGTSFDDAVTRAGRAMHEAKGQGPGHIVLDTALTEGSPP